VGERVTVFVAIVFSGWFPNATLVVLRPIVGPLRCNWYVSEEPPALAVSVTVCVPLTPDTHTLNPALEDPAGTVTEPGIDTALLLLLSVILRLFTTSWFIVTVQLSGPSAAIELVLHDNPLSWAAAPNEACGNANAKQPIIRPRQPARLSFRARSDDQELIVSASSAATARPKEGGTSFVYISGVPFRQNTPHPFAPGMLFPRRTYL
jgi:hypothetical protein